MTQRKIIHVDCDCFYAAIEMRDDPSLAQKPLAVGGSADRRGVIATCNYEARAYGVRSAMSSRHALKLCPDLTIVKPRMDAYKEASKEIQTIFRDYTDLIEPLSLDEAYLDVSDSPHFGGSATRIARAIVLAEPPSIDLGEITDKGSINQRMVLKHRDALVQALHDDTAPNIIKPQA